MAESRVQKYLKRTQAQKKKEPVEDDSQLSPLPTEDLVQIFSKLRGKNGKTPKEDELIKLIIPLIPKVKDGHTPTKAELLSIINPLIPKVKDGFTPKRGVDYLTNTDIEYMIGRATPQKGVHYFDGEDGKHGRRGKDAIMPDLRSLAISAINLLELFEGEDRLDVKAIKNIENLIRKIVSQETINFSGPGMIFTDKNTIAGSGLPGDPLRVIATGSGVNYEIPVGLIDGSNVVFTVTNTPKAILLNAATYFENDGYTYNSLTKTVTMLVLPVVGSTLRSQY